MKLAVRILDKKKDIEKTIEGKSISAIINEVISEFDGDRSNFEIFCEKCGGDGFQYLIFQGNKKVCVLQTFSP